ncbi:MAG: uracil-DNA glycosylase [Clostridia bacterium]|nr:uracil-DNA glycosylase [Clostridia bacterium]MBR5767224.1 uracil-DNA glycosylase [Clostridia bacterium]
MTWEELEKKCGECRRCGLWETRTKLVFGRGSRTAGVMFVGEAPGQTEDEQGVPFVGRAGKLLDLYFEAVGIERDEVYVANILKCRPPKNRDPLPEEGDACMEHLRDQVRLIRPKYIVCLGRIAAARLISPDFRISSQHGVWYKKGDFEICAVYHPSYLLRNPPGKREEMLDDMKKVAEKVAECRDS